MTSISVLSIMTYFQEKSINVVNRGNDKLAQQKRFVGASFKVEEYFTFHSESGMRAVELSVQNKKDS